MRRWTVEVRRRQPTGHPLSWPIVNTRSFWSEVGAKKYAGYWAYNNQVETRITHLGRIS